MEGAGYRDHGRQVIRLRRLDGIPQFVKVPSVNSCNHLVDGNHTLANGEIIWSIELPPEPGGHDKVGNVANADGLWSENWKRLSIDGRLSESRRRFITHAALEKFRLIGEKGLSSYDAKFSRVAARCSIRRNRDEKRERLC